MIASISSFLSYYKTKIDMNEIPLSKDYENNEKIESFDGILDSLENEREIIVEKKEKKQNRYSMGNRSITKEEKEVMEIGTKIHEYLEYLNFYCIDEELQKYEVEPFYRKKIKAFLHQPLFNQTILFFYKEYEFVIEENGEIKKGIIDLLIETENTFIIIDYKLKTIEKEEYKNQVEGYKKYIQKITDKKVEGYLYSILDEKLLKVE